MNTNPIVKLAANAQPGEKKYGNYSGSLLKATIFPLFEEKLDIN
ncbi:hypothetical protein [Methanosarcina mazei]|nr:hypothetical protein [Methanosarcina mazei]